MNNISLSSREIEKVLSCGFMLITNIGVIFYKNNDNSFFRTYFKLSGNFHAFIINRKLFIRAVMYRINFSNLLFKYYDLVFILYNNNPISFNSIYFL